MNRLAFFMLLLWQVPALPAQQTMCEADTLRFMFYNLWQYGHCAPTRADTLATLIDYLEPDIFMVCELADRASAADILDHALNTHGRTHYDSAAFVLNTSGFNSDLNNMLYFNRDKFCLLSQDLIQTPTRDINRYAMWRCDTTACGDSVFVDFFVGHLKAQDCSSCIDDRRKAIDSLRQYLLQHPPRQHAVFAGDLNIYGASEPAYQGLLNASVPPFHDPINAPGEWHNAPSFAEIHTQSTRGSAFGCSDAGGSLDDRFDFILTTENLLTGADSLRYLPGSYLAFGNDGQHFNKALLAAPHTGFVPDSIRTALYYMSDHLPVVMDVQASVVAPVAVAVAEAFPFDIQFQNPARGKLQLRIGGTHPIEGTLKLVSMDGKIVLEHPYLVDRGTYVFQLDLSQVGAGFYFLQVDDGGGGMAVRRVVVLK